jgi:hypothetical protein
MSQRILKLLLKPFQSWIADALKYDRKGTL